MSFKRGLATLALLGLTVGAFAAYTLHSFSLRWAGNNLDVSFSVSGLGNVSTAQFTVQATADVTVYCINRGNHMPSGLIRTTTNLSSTGTFPAVNGRTTATLELTAPDPSEFQHLVPPGMLAFSVVVTAYHNIQLIGPDGTVIKTVANFTR